MDEQIERAAEAIAQAQRVCVLTGAGVSAESGISTFRDAQSGLWATFDPMRLASQEGFADDPGLIWRWYMERLGAVEQAQPNPGHLALAELERLVPDFTLATQNVDNLHERAGSRHVLHLHGRITQYRCNGCGAAYPLSDADRTRTQPPFCTSCGAPVRPAVVWFGEVLPSRVLDKAYDAAGKCNVFLAVGTSGVVYPAAHLPHLAKSNGACVIEQNLDEHAFAGATDLYLQGKGGELLPALVDAVKRIKAD